MFRVDKGDLQPDAVFDIPPIPQAHYPTPVRFSTHQPDLSIVLDTQLPFFPCFL